ncbi:MAG: hypothetical protein ABI539_14505 [Acidobacteriota bacterium]
MSSSRLAVLVLITLSVLLTTNCSYFNRIMSRKDLVEGSIAYKERKFAEAEALFRKAAARDPEGATVEGRTAQLFLARTLHSKFIGDRQHVEYADEAIREYQKALAVDKNDQSSYKAIASLYDNLQRPDDWQKWVNGRANNAEILPQFRAEALTSLASRQNTCANEISDTEATKKKVTKDGAQIFQFSKPANPADFEKFKVCVAEGNKLIQQAIDLEPEAVRNAGNFNVATVTDDQLKATGDLIKVFESARSYRASLIIQDSRLAEMEGRTTDHDRLKQAADEAKDQFVKLSEVGRSIQTEVENRAAAKEEAENANAANANQK